MRAFAALIKREFLEHRGSFVTGPVVLLVLMLAAAGYVAFSSDLGGGLGEGLATALNFYETAFAFGAAGWLVYLVIMLFFYYGDAFSADSRDNSMLFWKSMPQSDLKILGAKVAASLTVFPLSILMALAVTGIIAYLPALVAGNMLPGYAPPGFMETGRAFVNILASALVLFMIAVLWYLPYLAWVGMLSVPFKRWAIPIAFLIPSVIGIFERIVRGGDLFQAGPVWTFISDRFQLDFSSFDIELYWLTATPWDAGDFVGLLIAGTDWVSLAGGVAVAAVLVFAASEYRRRYVLQ